ncbi:amino acid permease [Mycobacterium sp. 20091114027_K0903767]|uniref:APC family permease n=1 Tax=Mycolicibacterium porcinum TaxID=39693 RepID=UPI00080BD374|nr:APC family permease [Mycolicibacterium porcinum]MBX8686486.1 amino acid permease [Mycobacterium sp. 20091114027_K0903767]OCB42636.1 amino acid permease [Mycolicibacterium vulneris]TVX96034.1 APC family permease [Mycolicibacterium porcinum]
MAVKPIPAPDVAGGVDSGHTLKRGAIGLAGVVFMVVAFSAPITAMTGNLPVAVGFGNGLGAPAGFIIATVVLLVFSVGFVALARHITAAGAFYTFVSRGWSKIPGLPAGVLSMFTYMTMEAGLIGIFSAFADQAFTTQFGVDLPWIVYAALCLVVIAALSHWDISVAAKVLGVVLIAEIGMLTLSAVASLIHHPEGMSFTSLNPVTALSTNGVAGGVVGLGLLMAFWSWVGFESTAIYGEESKDPKRIVPRATIIAVIAIGVFYTFIAWGVIVGNGPAKAVELASGATPFEMLYTPAEQYLGHWAVTVFEWLVLGGSFACALAIHNSAARYLFAFGRDGLLPRRLGEAHPKHASPWIASLTQSVFAGIVLIICAVSGADPYAVLFVLVGILATICLLIVQTMSSVATVVYFHVKKQHPETASWWRTLAAPILGGSGMVYVIFLMASNITAAAGSASETLFFKMIPYIVVGLLAVSFGLALYWRKARPDLYERIGSTIFDDDQIDHEPIK